MFNLRISNQAIVFILDWRKVFFACISHWNDFHGRRSHSSRKFASKCFRISRTFWLSQQSTLWNLLGSNRSCWGNNNYDGWNRKGVLIFWNPAESHFISIFCITIGLSRYCPAVYNGQKTVWPSISSKSTNSKENGGCCYRNQSRTSLLSSTWKTKGRRTLGKN